VQLFYICRINSKLILTQEYITKVVKEYFKDKPVTKVYLFGSYAKGSANENSDIDVLVDLDYKKKIGFSFYTWYEELSNLLNKKVDVIANANNKNEVSNWRFIERINKEKMEIYEK
jgi:uncharacterized protein